MSNQQNDSVINWSEFHKPVVLEKGQWKKEKDSDESSYLLMKELKRAFSLISEFQEQHSQWLEQQAKDKQSAGEFNIPMNLAIVGERGSGKTSAVKSLKTILEEENYYVFDIVDPNTLSSEINILEILVSHIYKVICESEMEDLYQKEDAISLLKRIMTALGIKRQKDAFLRKDNPSIDVLDKIKDLVELDNLIVDLFEKFRKLVSRIWNKKDEVKDLVLIIDDLDLVDHKYIHKLISEIQEFLNSKLIIVLAYRNSQLEEAVLSDKVEKSRSLLDKGIISIEEISGQVERMLYKLLPLSYKICLYDQNELLKKSYVSIFDSLNIKKKKRIENLLSIMEEENDAEEEDISVEEWIYIKIQNLTSLYIKPVDEKETAMLFLPKSLREFIQLSEVLVRGLEESNSTDRFYGLERGIVRFREFFLNKVCIILPSTAVDMMNSWLFVDSHQKNYLCFHYFYTILSRENKCDKEEDEYPFYLNNVENYNLRLGDVYDIMELYKVQYAKQSIDFFVTYVMKILYSLELTNLILLAIKDIQDKKEDDNLEKYLKLINTSFMPDDYNYFEYISPDGIGRDYKFYYENEKYDAQFIEDFVTRIISTEGHLKDFYKKKNSAFRYRKVFSFDETEIKNSLVDKKFRDIEYFAMFTKKKYVEKAVQGYLEESSETKYVLMSMFQVDYFVRFNYSRKEDKKYSFVIREIERIFQDINGDLKKKRAFPIEKKYFQILNQKNYKIEIPYTQYKDEIDNLMGIKNDKEKERIAKELLALNLKFKSKSEVKRSIEELGKIEQSEMSNDVLELMNQIDKEYLQTNRQISSGSMRKLISDFTKLLERDYGIRFEVLE